MWAGGGVRLGGWAWGISAISIAYLSDFPNGARFEPVLESVYPCQILGFVRLDIMRLQCF